MRVSDLSDKDLDAVLAEIYKVGKNTDDLTMIIEDTVDGRELIAKLRAYVAGYGTHYPKAVKSP